MKKAILLLCFASGLAFSGFAGGNEEFRATWVITWNIYDASQTAAETQANIRTILDNHQRANMSAALWQVRQSGTAYYNSSFEPWGYYLGYQNPGFDPLAYAVAEAHQRGLELHAWFNVFQTSSDHAGSPAVEHPEWICRDGNGNPMPSTYALSPGLPEVREYLIKVAMEIVRNYDIDGLHLDYVRWSEYTTADLADQLAKPADANRLLDGMISPEQLQRLQKAAVTNRYLFDVEHPYSGGVPAGFSSWEDWWRWSVTEFVRTLHDSIQAVKPWVRLSPAALGKYNWDGATGWDGYNVVFQDAALWFNEGYIDQLAPMHYHWTTGSGFYGMLVGNGASSWGQFIQPGIAAGRLFTVGPPSYILDENNTWSRHPEIVASCRQVPWVDGFQFFSYGSWAGRKYWDQAKELFFNHKVKIRAAKLFDDTAPEAPIISLTKNDSLHYQIDVTPPAIIDNHWFALYRSEDDNLDVAADEILDIHFGTEPYSFVDVFDGLQDFNGTYQYFATVLDRYWNESAVSNSLPSDSIPSFAPTVIAHTPAADDTVAVNSPLQLTFSKTMEINSLVGAITITPTETINQLKWASDHKSVTVVLTKNFDFGTDYTVTLAPSLTDVNGTGLDGNGDGIAGDAYIFHFRTRVVDVDGPVILASYPEPQPSTTAFDPWDILTILFDEIVAPATVSDTTIALLQGADTVPIGMQLVRVGEQSVLSIQPLQNLSNNSGYTLCLSRAITDTSHNPLKDDFVINFMTSESQLTTTSVIDEFLAVSNWASPSYSGSTVGIVVGNTTFSLSKDVYLPAASRPVYRNSAALTYQWDESQSEFLIREYCSGDAARAVQFDTSYVLQCYLFGDGSGNQFRFALDEGDSVSWPFHEVSQWVTIDWFGWRVIEWQLNDPNSVGSWIGNGILDGAKYRIDSFQLTHPPEAAVSGRIFFDNLRAVKKTSGAVTVAELAVPVPERFYLYQNFPNPFNPATQINFDLPQAGQVKLTVYDLLGREVAILLEQFLSAGSHQVRFDGSQLSSGVYICRLQFNDREEKRRMVLLK